MMNIVTTLEQALVLLISGDSELWSIIFVSFSVSLSAILITLIPALATGFCLAYCQFSGRHLLISLFQTMLALPTVVIGLLLYMLFSRSGPVGDLQLLFTRQAMIIGQIILSFPILVSMSYAVFQAVDNRLFETVKMLGAPWYYGLLTLLYEVRCALLVAIIAGLSRIISEVGCSMMVGGNILHYTRNIPTAIALETSKGEFAQGIALGIVLLILALGLNFLMVMMQEKPVN